MMGNGLLLVVFWLVMFLLGTGVMIVFALALWRMAQAQSEMAQALRDLAAQQRKQA